MRLLLILLFAVPASADDLKKFQGQWISVEIRRGANKAAQAGDWVRLRFQGNQCQGWSSGDPNESTEFRIRLDSTAQPKRIELSILQRGKVVESVMGLYKFEKDRLVLCYDQGNIKSYPSDFKRGRTREITVLEREKTFRKRLEKVFD